MNESIPRADVVLLLATPAEQYAVEAIAARRNCRLQVSRRGYSNVITLGTTRVVTAWAGEGPYNAAATMIAAHRDTLAAKVVAVGMCFGVREADQRLGDVLVSTALIPYDRRRVMPSTSPDRRWDIEFSRRMPASRALVERLRRVDDQSHAANPFRVHFGAMLSGGARIHSTAFRDELVQSVPAGADPIIGGEMEGIGLSALGDDGSPSSGRSELGVGWVVVKGISDFATDDGAERAKDHRARACENAVEFLFRAFELEG